MTAKKIFMYVLFAYAMCQLAALVSDVFVLIMRRTAGAFYGLANPNPMDGRGFTLPAAIDLMVEITNGWIVWVRANFQYLVNRVIRDDYSIASMVVMTAVLEEIQYRGPLLLLKKCPAYAGWSAALLLNAWFLLGHDTAPIFLANIFVMAMMCAWLVRKTGKIWPGMILHMVYNMYWNFGGLTILRG